MQGSIFQIDKLDLFNLISFKACNFAIVFFLFSYVRTNFSNQDFIDFGFYWNMSLLVAGVFFGGLSATIIRVLSIEGGIKTLVDSKILNLFITFNILIGLLVLLIIFLKPNLNNIYFFLLFCFGLFFQIQTLLITIIRVKKLTFKMNVSAIFSVLAVLICFNFLSNAQDSTEKLFLNLVSAYMFSIFIIIIFLKSSLVDLYDPSSTMLDVREYKESYIAYSAITSFSYAFLTLDFYFLRELLSEEQMLAAGSTKIYFDRFIIPFLTIISGIFSLNVYRTKSNSIIGNKNIRINFRIKKQYLVIIPLFVIFISYFYIAFYSSNNLVSFYQAMTLTLCYIIYSVNGVLLDGVAIKHKPKNIILLVAFMLFLSYFIYYFLIGLYNINGWILGMAIINIIGFFLFYKSITFNKSRKMI